MPKVPGLDEEQRRRAGRMDGDPHDLRVDLTRVINLEAKQADLLCRIVEGPLVPAGNEAGSEGKVRSHFPWRSVTQIVRACYTRIASSSRSWAWRCAPC